MIEGGEARGLVERVLDVTVFAPIGLVTLAGEHLPELVASGRRTVEQRVVLARFVGRLAVEQGRRQLAARAASTREACARESAAPPPRAPDPPTPSVVPPAVAVDDGPPPPADALPIDEYESLAASHVVARLAGLDAAELDLVERFERAHRNRRTVLGRIHQLRSAS